MTISDLKQDHPRIYARVLECQMEQRGKQDDTVDLRMGSLYAWDDTREGYHIWSSVDSGNYQPWYDFWDKEKSEPSLITDQLKITPFVVMRRMVNQSEQYNKEGEYKASLLTLEALAMYVTDSREKLQKRIKQSETQ